MKNEIAQTVAKNPEIAKGIAMTLGSFGLMELNALAGFMLACIGIAYTLRKWYLMEKHKKDMSKPPFKAD